MPYAVPRLSQLLGSAGELGEAFAAFKHERRPRAERVVALARRNGNHKRQFSPAGAWIRDRMLKVLIPISVRSQDWMYGYDPGAA